MTTQHIETLSEMFQVAANERRMKEADAISAAIDALRAEAGAVGDQVLCFVAEVMEDWHEGDLDGGQRQDWAEKYGLLIPTEVTESCGEHCECAEYSDFPQTCYRPSDILKQANAALAQARRTDRE